MRKETDRPLLRLAVTWLPVAQTLVYKTFPSVTGMGVGHVSQIQAGIRQRLRSPRSSRLHCLWQPRARPGRAGQECGDCPLWRRGREPCGIKFGPRAGASGGREGRFRAGLGGGPCAPRRAHELGRRCWSRGDRAREQERPRHEARVQGFFGACGHPVGSRGHERARQRQTWRDERRPAGNEADCLRGHGRGVETAERGRDGAVGAKLLELDGCDGADFPCRARRRRLVAPGRKWEGRLEARDARRLA